MEINKVGKILLVIIAVLASFFINMQLSKKYALPYISEKMANVYTFDNMKVDDKEYLFGIGSGYFEINSENTYKKIYIEYVNSKNESASDSLFIKKSKLNEDKVYNAYKKIEIDILILIFGAISLGIFIASALIYARRTFVVVLAIIFVPMITSIFLVFLGASSLRGEIELINTPTEEVVVNK